MIKAAFGDLEVINFGSIVVLKALNEQGDEWIEENIGENDELQWWAGGVVVEPRYIDDIVAGAQNDGLEVIG